MSRRDYVREGFCPTLAFGYLKNVEKKKKKKKKQSRENSHGKSQKFGKEKSVTMLNAIIFLFHSFNVG